MRARALVGIFVFGLLFGLLLVATRASSVPLESAHVETSSSPVWGPFQPTGWVTRIPVTCVIKVYNADGLFPSGNYAYSTDRGATWSGPLNQNLTIAIDEPRTTVTMTVTNLSFPDSLTTDQNQIRFSIYDSGGVPWSSDPYSVRVDTSAPTSTVSTSGCHNSTTWPGEIRGTASDSGSGVSRVDITLRNSSGLYYNGSGWQPGETWLLATGTTNWYYRVNPDEGAYVVQSRAIDVAGNVQATPDEKAFTYDSSGPQSRLQMASCYNAVTPWPGAIQGTASDSVSGIVGVQVAVQRASDGYYYNGSSWNPNSAWMTAFGTTNWSVSFTPDVQTTYTVTSKAADACGNVEDPPAVGIFSYDIAEPQSTVLITGCFNANTNWPGALYGSASDATSGIANVQVRVQRASDGHYYNGADWVSNPDTWLTTQGTTLWTLPFTPLEETTYTVQSKATDNCGNVQTSLGLGIFSRDVTFPTSSVNTAGHFNTWSGAITGTASDALSGVTTVQISLKRASDNLYYNGLDWGEQERWITVSGTTTWSFPFIPPRETTYTVKSKAIDGCGNVQSPYGLATFTYDVTAPSPPFAFSIVPSIWSKTNAFTMTWNNPADISGIAKAHYKWDVEPTSNNDQSVGSPVLGVDIHSLNLAVPVQGTHQLYLWLEDAAGNVDFQRRNVAGPFRWDAAAPLTSIAGVTGTLGCAGWYTSTVQVGTTAVDVNPDPMTINATSDVSATFWRQDGGSWNRVLNSTFVVTGEGAHTVEYYSVDNAGNQEIAKQLTPQVKIDTLPPTSSEPSYTGTRRPNSDWYTSTVTVSISAVDATSGVAAIYHQINAGVWVSETGASSSFVVADDGVHTIRYYAMDTACNRENTRTVPVPLKIDKTPPNTRAQLDGVRGDNDWFVASPVTVTLRPSDVVTGVQSSGVDRLWYRVDGGNWVSYSGSEVSIIVAGEGVHTIECSAIDLAGNVEPTRVLTVGIDTQAPPAMPYAPYVVPSGWARTNCFDIRWYRNPSDLSGIGGAYYSFAVPRSPTDGTLVLGDNITSIPCVQVPAELGDGAHNVYIWLRDKAGNSDHLARHMVTLYLDQTPPQIQADVAGNQCGGWYNSPVTVTFVATDIPSGMAGGVISYHVVGEGDWVVGNSYCESRDGRWTIEARAQDAAGNVSSIITTTLKLDQTAPGAPISLRVDPAAWSRENSFSINWLNPTDRSGIAGVYYKLESPPISPTDGILVEGSLTSIAGISVTRQGETAIYVWLVDRACNSDHQKRAMGTLRYDSTAPTTSFSASGSLGGDGWYVSPVQISLTCEDYASGCSSSYYRIRDGSWHEGTSFSIADPEGIIAFNYYSVDFAGNAESARTGSVKIDRVAPSSRAYADSYSQSTSFIVHWTGSDTSSGIATFDVQYRSGTNGTWQDWITNVDSSQTSALFVGGAAGKTYYFRSRARDRAGNQESYPDRPDAYVAVDPLFNGDFERNSLTGWEGSGPCPPTVVITQSYSGGSTHVAVLGCPDRNQAPFGESMICQTVDVPRAQDMPAPTLRFRYHILSYDVLWGPNTKKFWDSFNVGLCPPGSIAPTWVFTDGNSTDFDLSKLKDLGWREGSIDLTPWAGRRMKICLANVTRWDDSLNTWTFVDDIRIVDLENKFYLPVVLRAAPALGMAANARPSLMPLGTSGIKR